MTKPAPKPVLSYIVETYPSGEPYAPETAIGMLNVTMSPWGKRHEEVHLSFCDGNTGNVRSLAVLNRWAQLRLAQALLMAADEPNIAAEISMCGERKMR